MKTIVSLILLLSVLAAGCDRAGSADDTAEVGIRAANAPAPAVTAPAVPTRPSATRPAAAAPPRVVFLGDSLTAGLGVEADEAFPARVGEMLQSEGISLQIVNAGVSGDTTAGGLRRIDWVLKQSPDVVVVGLGGNDGLRATELKASEQNLRDIIRRSRDAGAKVLLLGMLIPPNYGPEYTAQFRDLYGRIAKEMSVPLVPFVLEGVGGDPRLNQPDGIHPTAQGHRIVAANVAPYVRDLVRQPAKALEPQMDADERR